MVEARGVEPLPFMLKNHKLKSLEPYIIKENSLLSDAGENLVLFQKCTKMHLFALFETGQGTGQFFFGNLLQHYSTKPVRSTWVM